MYDRWLYQITEHDCSTCGHPLLKVDASNLLTCADPLCEGEPMFLIPKGA